VQVTTANARVQGTLDFNYGRWRLSVKAVPATIASRKPC